MLIESDLTPGRLSPQKRTGVLLLGSNSITTHCSFLIKIILLLAVMTADNLAVNSYH